MKLQGRNAIVTGGSLGLGRSIVEAFLREGANVFFCARNGTEVERTASELRSRLGPGQQLVSDECDISNPADLDRMFAKAAALGDLHILVNNAGIYGPIGAIEEISFEEWKRTFDINLFGAVLAAQRAIPIMKLRGYGKLIQISGGGAAPIPNYSAYTVSKMALTRLTEALALELLPFRIDCNAVAPGPLNTRLIQEVLNAGPERAGSDFYAKNLSWSSGDAVSTELGANVCVYLASAESDGITGKLLAAQWDPWERLHEFKSDLASDIYTFRRIVPKDRGRTWGDK